MLVDAGAEMLLHLGDVGTVEVIDALAEVDEAGERIEAHLVFGNTDWDLETLRRYAEGLGVAVAHPAGRLELKTGLLYFCHGHQPEVMKAGLREGARYLCHGHTHRTLDTVQGPTRIINPGALFRAETYTVALLDTDTDELEFLTVDEGPGPRPS
ncbi:Calcineurin-like phosphoesterase superfamily domain protein [Mucisphaera calidilacus]|uniref:Calcineurin-like phosphoesterase superfamily domain protein n=2 Tax=Mucisphaera calidilacus TaxID=2527982 RepID=A0A518BXA0_9BACT|nr:Calcineurin-like phosphoesterase superfamily domain protein [Mucisphaera calidilacus]